MNWNLLEEFTLESFFVGLSGCYYCTRRFQYQEEEEFYIILQKLDKFVML